MPPYITTFSAFYSIFVEKVALPEQHKSCFHKRQLSKEVMLTWKTWGLDGDKGSISCFS